MKTTCNACQATYSIPEQALELGRFGFSCRRCEGRILVEASPELFEPETLSRTRSESSLLFTTSSVRKALDDDASASISMSALPESSGLLDIRRARAAYRSSLGKSEKVSASATFVCAASDLLAPVAVAPASGESRVKPLLYGILGATGAIALAAVVVLAFVLSRDAAANTFLEPDPVEAIAELPSAEPDPMVDAEPDSEPEPVPEPVPEPESEPEPPVRSERSASRRTNRTRPAPTPKPIDRGEVDEYVCIIENYEPKGCEKYREQPEEAPPVIVAPPAAPEVELTRHIISTTMKSANSALRICGDNFGPGNVKVRVKVTPAGEVSSVKVVETPFPGLGKCVSKAVAALSFPATARGSSFDYLFPVR